MRARAFNPQIFLESLCYCVFGGLMLYLVTSGKYLSYVTPRMKPYLYLTAVVMGIWVFVGLGRLFRPQHKIRSAHCFVLAIPILLLALPHSPLSMSDLSGNYITSGYGAPQKQVPTTGVPTGASAENSTEPAAYPSARTLPEDTAPSAIDTATAVPDMQTAGPEDAYLVDLPGLDAADRRITVSNDDFGRWISEIYTNMEKYRGYTVVMTGSVFKNPETLQQDEFIPARLMMSCCVADLAPAGLVCRYDRASELKKDSWVTVEGTLFIGQYEYEGEKYDDPRLAVTKVTPAEEVKGYVYPY